MKIDLDELKTKKTIKELLDFGIINIDKPSGPTSFNISDYVRKSLEIKKTSHFGTLDPKVTGVLPIALGRACKLSGFFISREKEYVGIMRLHGQKDISEINAVIKREFMGKIKQLPPVRSRVKRQIREREIFSFEILENEEKDYLFKTLVQGGTYIRKLVHDLGENLGLGAHMLELRRTKAGIFVENEKKYSLVSMYDFEKAVSKYKSGDEKALREIIIPAEVIVNYYESLEIKEESLKRIFTGKPVYQEDLKERNKIKEGEIVIIFCKKMFVGVYQVINKKEIFCQPLYVLQPV